LSTLTSVSDGEKVKCWVILPHIIPELPPAAIIVLTNLRIVRFGTCPDIAFSQTPIVGSIPALIPCCVVSHFTIPPRHAQTRSPDPLSTCASILTLSPTNRSCLPLVGRITNFHRAHKYNRTAASYAPREATVLGIYTKLQHHKFIHICPRSNS
jgi:hypothetical protein